MVGKEYGSHTHGMFWTGMVLTPLLLQGWIPVIATFLNTPAWTMSAEAFYYTIFPWLARWKRPERMVPHLEAWPLVWGLGLVPGLLYMAYSIRTASRIRTAGVTGPGCRRSNIRRCRTWPALSSA
jgi:peptidoglycan/LPS O-acetylase OafA/YrhL